MSPLDAQFFASNEAVVSKMQTELERKRTGTTVIGAVDRVNALPSSTQSLRVAAVDLAVTVRRIAVGASFWSLSCYNSILLSIERQIFEGEFTYSLESDEARAALPDDAIPVDSVLKNIPNSRTLQKQLLLCLQGNGGLCMQATHIEGRSRAIMDLYKNPETPKYLCDFIDAMRANVANIDGLSSKEAEQLYFKFRLSNLSAPLQVAVDPASGDGVSNKNVKNFILCGSTYHKDDKKHPDDRQLSYGLLEACSKAALAVKKPDNGVFRIEFNDPDRALFGGEKTFGKRKVNEGDRIELQHMASHSGGPVMCWVHAVKVKEGHRIPGKALSSEAVSKFSESS